MWLSKVARRGENLVQYLKISLDIVSDATAFTVLEFFVFWESEKELFVSSFLYALYITSINHFIAFSCHSDFGCIAKHSCSKKYAAMEILGTQKLPTNQSASLCGFSNPHCFAKAFRKFTGVSGSKCKKINKTVPRLIHD